MHTLNFNSQHNYGGPASGITVPIRLAYGSESVGLLAKIDTGAEFCLFARDYGEMLGIDIESGERKTLSTLTSTFVVFGHEVVLRVLDFEFPLFAYFPMEGQIRRNLLGRQGWLMRVRLGLVDYDQVVFLSRYDDD